jgi:hypothetical protein
VDRWASGTNDGHSDGGSQCLSMSHLKRTFGDTSEAEQELEESLGGEEVEGRGRGLGKSKTVGFKRQMTTKVVKLTDYPSGKMVLGARAKNFDGAQEIFKVGIGEGSEFFGKNVGEGGGGGGTPELSSPSQYFVNGKGSVQAQKATKGKKGEPKVQITTDSPKKSESDSFGDIDANS